METQEILKSLGITKDDLVERVAHTILDEDREDDYIRGLVKTMVEKRVTDTINGIVSKKVNEVLDAELSSLLSREYVPVDIWGEPVGKPTTIRDRLLEYSKKYWDQPVDKEGKPSTSYGTRPRHEWLFAKAVYEEFAKAVKQDYTNVVGALKDALKESAIKELHEHLDKIIQVRTGKDSPH